MTNHTFKCCLSLVLLAIVSQTAVCLPAQTASHPKGKALDSPHAASAAKAASQLVAERFIQADMGFLASDELHGRGSATRDEHLAALYTASRLQALGLLPAGDNGTYIQKSPVPDI